ncbi:UNVERIFIED_CONTAM: hypothetical protein GTU68_061707 [Idotea baltica]|nr:hypothetical protein [Idotea baltica]
MSSTVPVTTERIDFGRIKSFEEYPNLLEIQETTPENRTNEGLFKVFMENFPITDSRNIFVLEFLDYFVDPPRYSIEECMDRGLTYSVPLKAKLRLSCNDEEHIDFQTIVQDVFLGNIPYMSPKGTFIVNGAERVVVSQLHRSPGVFFSQSYHPNGTKIFSARVIPFKGAWIEFATDINNVMFAYIDRKKKFPVTTLLRAIGYDTDKAILDLFDLAEEIENTLQKDTANSEIEAVKAIYKQLRGTDAPDEETARGIIDKMFFSDRRYDLGEVGRYKINKKLKLETPEETRVLTKVDIITIVKYLVMLVNSKAEIDDIDHLSNRRVRTVGEQLYAQFGVGLARMARTIRERMNVRDNEVFTPVDLINARTLSSVINSFFGTSQLSQFLDQTNPLSEITHKRRISALGPGGLSRERAGFEVRDVHYSHYGRLCTIETPEGPNIGLISTLCVHAKVNKMGFIETPYRKVDDGKAILDGEGAVSYLSAEEEDLYTIGQASAPIDETGAFTRDKVKGRQQGEFPILNPSELNYLDVAPNQIVGVSASLIPFLENDDANRALMGSNMQRQAVPLLIPEAPIVGTGIEKRVAKDSRMLLNAEGEGIVEYVDANKIVIRYDKDDVKTYHLTKFHKTNQGTCINQKPIVMKGQRLAKGEILCEGYATDNGELALGRNMKVAFMPWKGYNFEDAIVLSERVVKDDIFTSLHIEEFTIDVRDTKLGEEELTNDIPNVSEEATRDLDDNGIIRVGAHISEGDIIIGKITPKGESDPTPEEKLLRAIFGDKAGDVKDASLRVKPSVKGVVIGKRLFARAKKDELNAGVLKLAKVYVAKKRKLKVGDKLAGRHGNKGIVARIVREEDMPFLEDGTSVDIVLNPLGVPSRMNIGQIYETVLGWAGKEMGVKYATPIFDGATVEQIEHEVSKAGLPALGVTYLYDGETGERFFQPVTVGVIYMLKLAHMIDDKMHARSIGPYSLITQQPLGGKAQFGGQRFGEMEVWALQAFGAASILQEMLTLKSDDISGRSKTYEAIVKGENLPKPNIPESFNVLLHELRGLALDVVFE